MDILFIGQQGIPATGNAASGAAERRVTAVATQLASEGHRVAVTCAWSYTRASLTQYNGVVLVRLPSLRFGLVGRFLYALLSLVSVWRRQPDVVHAHGWFAGVLLPLARLFSSSTTFVWTVDTVVQLPSFVRRMIVARAARTCVAVTVPTRSLQYTMLHLFGVRASYVPDGYTVSTVPDVPLTQFGVRKGQYTIFLAGSAESLGWVARGYAATKTRKRLVVPQDASPRLRSLRRRYPFLHVVGMHPHKGADVSHGALRGRSLMSLIRHAAVVIVGDSMVSGELLLQSMDAGRAMIAPTYPLYEELLGIGAQFVQYGDTATLSRALRSLVTTKSTQALLGRLVRQRAQAHFTWSRVVADYVGLYRSAFAHRVPLDSVRRPVFAEVSART